MYPSRYYSKPLLCVVCFLLALFFVTTSSHAQNARMQLIHNSGDIDANNMDVIVDGDTLIMSFDFRSATEFMDFTAGSHDFELVVADPASGDPVTEGPFTVTLDANVTYVGIIGGISALNIDRGAYSNPEGRDIGLTVFSIPNVRETPNDPTKVEFIIFHGSTDAPTIDVVVNDMLPPLVDDLDYGQASDYFPVDPAVYTLDVTPSDDNTSAIRSFEADLTGLANSTAVVFASGFVDPINNQGAPVLGLFAALPSGDVVAFEDITPGEIGDWEFAGPSEYEFDDFFGADTLVDGGHGVAVDKFNRIWVGNFRKGLVVISPEGVQAPFSPIDTVTVEGVKISTRNSRGLAVAHDGNILTNDGSELIKINVETGQGMAVWTGAGSLLKVGVDQFGLIYAGLVVGINPITVLNPDLTVTQEITLNAPPSFGRGLEVTADGRTIFTPDLGQSGGAVYIWTTTDLLTYDKTDSIVNNTEGQAIFKSSRQTFDWGPDSTLWVSVDNATNTSPDNELVVLDFSNKTYKTVAFPEIDNNPTLTNGPRGVAFSVTGDTAYAIVWEPGNRMNRYIKNTTSVADGRGSIPAGYVLEQNYPNPFNPATTIEFQIGKKGEVDLDVYNLLGQRVATLIEKKALTAGRHTVTFDASSLASGVYYYKLKVNEIVLSRKMMLVK